MNYKEFLLEKAINESFLYYTTDFRKMIIKISKKNNIAKDLLNIEQEDIKQDISFINLSDKEGYVKFSQMKKALEILKKWNDEKEYYGNDEFDIFLKQIEGENVENSLYSRPFVIKHFSEIDNFTTRPRNEIKIGKLVKQIFKNKYSDKEIEEFVNLFKSYSNNGSTFKIVEGEEIKHWYNKKNYLEESGDLGNSCMRYESCQDYFNIYIKNPEICKLLILTNSSDELLGRALLWKLNNDCEVEKDKEKPIFYLDRIYTIDDSTKTKFEQYAEENDYMYRLSSSFNQYKDFQWRGEEFEDYKINIKLDKFKFESYPYMDTFKRLDVEEGVLHNDEETDENSYGLTQTDGSYQDYSGLYSRYYGEYIPEEEAIWSPGVNSYIYSRSSINVLGHGPYPDDHDDVYFDNFRDEYIYTSDATWSEFLQADFYSEDATTIIVWVNDNLTQSIDNFSHVTDEVSKYYDKTVSISFMDCEEYLKHNNVDLDFASSILVYSNKSSKYYIDELSITLYETEKGNYTKEDCEVLNLKPGKAFNTDSLAYNYSLDVKPLIEKYILKIKEIENKLENIVSGKEKSNFEDFFEQKLEIFKSRLDELKKWVKS